ncbi:MAG: PucR family transcriptional regulator [Faecousia sp.]
MLEKAFLFNPRLIDSCVNPLSGILRDLLNGVPIELSRKQHHFSGSMDGWYICAKIVPSSLTSSKVTSSYILQHIETTFPGSNAFETDGYLVALIDLIKVGCDEKTTLYSLRRLLKEMGLRAGVSCPFQNLLSVRLYFRQAVLALELGGNKDAKHCCYCFSDYKLSYMCISSLGEFSVENMMSAGFARLVRHDAASQTNYVQTLRVYLNNNMNSSKTAQELFIHRSTFQERLQRIESMLDLNLEDPAQRLYLMLMLQILEEQGKENTTSETLTRLAELPEPKSTSLVRILYEY